MSVRIDQKVEDGNVHQRVWGKVHHLLTLPQHAAEVGLTRNALCDEIARQDQAIQELLRRFKKLEERNNG